MNVAIFDDSMQIIQRLKELVQESGVVEKIDWALTYENAFSLLKHQITDVVIIDLNFDNNKTYELLKEIKSNFKRIKIIVLSIHIDEDIQNDCLQHGADYFFDKYHEFEKIPGLIKSFYKKN